MKQNKYDESSFFNEYSRMPRSTGGLEAAGEWPELRRMLPNLKDKSVLDLGCGYGWHCRYAVEQGAKSVLGIDISEKMLERARGLTDHQHIEYRRVAIEDLNVDDESFEVVISSLAIHYIGDFESLGHKVHRILTPGGHFVFSVEHPMFTALEAQDFYYDTTGTKLHWPVDNYHLEGVREADFLGHAVMKYHRTVSTYVNGLLSAGFRLTQISELKPTAEMLSSNPAYEEELRRPMFMLISAVKEW
ncbi:class I SAM-dependent methyltransferase [Paenibacillus sp. 453mf]|uniref:class I SAM-dependent methyltransferase n=1 Tax=Paenibacillus sp. 453mf TaxID=1761874 RepID=UPI0008EEF97B|nr:class I SAM-dependent methyltransferase [Paenibacillus sp. 453mf]SFS57072.1 Methyltransferase domain-containing protein [Paenibacillus sp. 453mf]